MILCKEYLNDHKILNGNTVVRRTSGGTKLNLLNSDFGINSAPMSRKFKKSTPAVGNDLQNGIVHSDFKTITSVEFNKMLDLSNSNSSSVKAFVILDLRDSRQYQNGHVVGARSANCSTKLMSKKTVLQWTKTSCDIENFILYDQHSDLPSLNSPQMLLIERLLQDNKKITFLQGGFDEFKKVCNPDYIESSIPKEALQNYQYSPTNVFVNNSEDVLNATASRIFQFAFIGNERDSSDLELLKELKITHILNVTSTSPFYFQSTNRFRYHRLPASDSHMQNLRILYDDAFDFIDEARHSEGRILIHCWAGVSRSPSIMVAYLLKHSDLTVLEAVKFLQEKRPIVAPNINFMGQLERYYLDLNQNLEKRSVDMFDDDFMIEP